MFGRTLSVSTVFGFGRFGDSFGSGGSVFCFRFRFPGIMTNVCSSDELGTASGPFGRRFFRTSHSHPTRLYRPKGGAQSGPTVSPKCCQNGPEVVPRRSRSAPRVLPLRSQCCARVFQSCAKRVWYNANVSGVTRDSTCTHNMRHSLLRKERVCNRSPHQKHINR